MESALEEPELSPRELAVRFTGMRRHFIVSTLNKWVTAHRDTEVVSEEDLDFTRENEWLRYENRIRKEEYPSWSRPSFGPHAIAA